MKNTKLSFSENRFLRATIYIKQLGFFADLIAIENSSLHLKEKSVIIATLYAASEFDKKHDKFNYNSENLTNCLQSKSLWKGKFCDNHGRQMDLAEEIANHFKNGHYSVRTYPQVFFTYFSKGNIKMKNTIEGGGSLLSREMPMNETLSYDWNRFLL